MSPSIIFSYPNFCISPSTLFLPQFMYITIHSFLAPIFFYVCHHPFFSYPNFIYITIHSFPTPILRRYVTFHSFPTPIFLHISPSILFLPKYYVYHHPFFSFPNITYITIHSFPTHTPNLLSLPPPKPQVMSTLRSASIKTRNLSLQRRPKKAFCRLLCLNSAGDLSS